MPPSALSSTAAMVLLVVGVAVSALRAQAPAEARIEIGPLQLVGTAGPDLPIWLEVAADSGASGTLIVCGMRTTAGSPRRAFGFVERSDNAGRSWARTLTVADAPFVSEGTCAIGVEGQAYFIAQPGDGARASSAVLRFYRSVDAGRTWLAPTEQPFADLTTMTVDTGASAGRGRVYVAANGFRRRTGVPRAPTMDLFAAAPGDARLTGPIQPIADGERTGGAFPGAVRVLPDGRPLAVYHTGVAGAAGAASGAEGFARYVEVVRSLDGGRTWQRPERVAAADRWGLPDSPSLAIDPRSGRATVAWSAFVGERSRILTASSDDGGVTWSAPETADDTTAALPGDRIVVAHPNVAIDRRGREALTWFDAQRKCWRVRARVRASDPWTYSSQALSACGAGEPSARDLYGSLRQWETGLAVDAESRFWPVWAARRSDDYVVVTRAVRLD
jgi:hypothetical protein